MDRSCPIPFNQYPNVLLAHGGGGRMMHQLIDEMFLSSFGGSKNKEHLDGAILELKEGKAAFTTDSYVVRPLFFPGGDIGTLAVNGTVNDLAMCGARPLYLSAGFILEEGLPMATLWRVVQSMARAAEQAGVRIITGDTKVVERKKGDEVLINTAGIGIIEHDRELSTSVLREGDVILLNGDIGRHGIAVMAFREGLSFESAIESDCDDLSGLVREMLDANIEIKCLRDLTRGGLGVVLTETAESAGHDIYIDENTIPVSDAVRGACEILGLDPLFVANEGRLAAFVSAKDADRALEVMRKHRTGSGAAKIGKVVGKGTGQVNLKTEIGTTRIVDMPSGEQLPRIC
ncbi:hydrogenase [Candidatus Nitromaritima sp. SCGC AAA799-C22]|nr:hydrogenase [Candidatus Nitromaritima sp. SCGC AAA799-C22]